MYDINNTNDIQVIQPGQNTPGSTHTNVFVMCTEHVAPCFAMLRSVKQIENGELFNACQDMNGSLFFSSYLFVHNRFLGLRQMFSGNVMARQGPSIEHWTHYMDTSESGTDTVHSIHCPFWPDEAQEWPTRPQNFEWPSSNDLKTIVGFGFHLVPIGHPHSTTNLMEWRISFSVAERTLVLSFNHIQMQCYAVMKLILKEFINPHCSPPCRVLCSYFIKTFLFWEYEETGPSFWCIENVRECFMYLLSKFRECIRIGSLKHYFIPSFNLLSVKMTDGAKIELLRIFDIILQSDIRIIKECKTMNKVWMECLNDDALRSDMAETIKRRFLRNNKCMMNTINTVLHYTRHTRAPECCSPIRLINEFVNRCIQTSPKTHLISLTLRIILINASILLGNIPLRNTRNKSIHRPFRFLQSNPCGIEISTSRLWYTMLMTKRGDYRSSLQAIQKVLSCISPFALYFTGLDLPYIRNETKSRYVDM